MKKEELFEALGDIDANSVKKAKEYYIEYLKFLIVGLNQVVCHMDKFIILLK